MSRTRHRSKGPGYEYWSRRPYAGSSPGRQTKKLTHRAERRQAEEEIQQAVDEEWQALLDMIDAPPEPTEELKQAMERHLGSVPHCDTEV